MNFSCSLFNEFCKFLKILQFHAVYFVESPPHILVSVESKRMGNVTLSYSTETFDTYLSPTDVLEWQTLFKSAISPCGTKIYSNQIPFSYFFMTCCYSIN